MKHLIIALIRGYRFLISPLMGKSCRFHPTCSHYMIDAINKYGVLKGVGMGTRRLCKCHPYYNGDFHDPVP